MAKLKSFEQYVAEKQASANQEEINNLEVQEASVIMDAVDPKSKGLAKLLKKNKVSMEVIDQDGPSGFPEVELTGKREDLETVLADSQYGWDDADLAEYIEESKDTFTVKVKSIEEGAKEEEIEEGNAFGDAVRKAKEAGETEFEFEGETYKVEESEEVTEGKAGVNTFLANIANDYQFDKKHDQYSGFLNTEPSDMGDDAIEFINNVDKYKSLMKKHGLSLEPGYSDAEAIFIKESEVNEAEIKSDEEFTEYANTVLQKAFGEDFDEAKAKEAIDGILSKSDGDYGAAVGMLTSSLG